MEKTEILKIIGVEGSDAFACGSRITCNPPIMGTDEDWLVLVNNGSLFSRLEGLGFKQGGSRIAEKNILGRNSSFFSFSKDSLNLIITLSGVFFNKFRLATSTAKALNLMKKTDRITLFQAILYGNAND